MEELPQSRRHEQAATAVVLCDENPLISGAPRKLNPFMAGALCELNPWVSGAPHEVHPFMAKKRQSIIKRQASAHKDSRGGFFFRA